MCINMDNWITKSAKSFSNKGGIFTFLRAQLSSQLASFIDFLVTIVLANVFNLFYVYATFTGSICGGITNCIVNYRWTFKAMHIKKRYVAIRYIFVWIGSIFLNTTGIFLMTELIKKIPLLMKVPDLIYDNIFIISKIVVSLLVGIGWNYVMHRFFVYKNLHLERFLDRKIHKKHDNIK